MRSSPRATECHRAALTIVAGLLAFTAFGCVTTERVVGSDREIRQINDDPDYKDKKEVELLEQSEEQPDAAAVWWQLGDYYERNQREIDALNAYKQMLRCEQLEEKKQGRRFTGALYLCGKVATKLGDYSQALRYLEEVLRLQPKTRSEASVNKNFRESHYLLGAIYFKHHQFELAEDHFVTFKELGGGHRADGYLIQIEDELGPRSSEPTPASAEKKGAEPAQKGS